MSKTKNGFRDFFLILIGVNIGHVIFGAALGSQETGSYGRLINSGVQTRHLC